MRVFHLFGHLVVKDGEVYDEFYPYFYTTQRPERQDPIIDVEDADFTVYEPHNGAYRETSRRVWKVVVRSPSDVPQLRMKFGESSQSYIKYAARASIDMSVKSWHDLLPAKNPADVIKEPPNPRFAVFDIELTGKLFFGLGFGKDVKIFECGYEEIECLRQISTELLSLNVDYLVGYNNWEFDQPKLRKLIPNFVSKYAVLTANGLTPVMDLFVLATSRFSSSLGLQEKGLDLVSVASQVALTKEEAAEAVKVKRLRSRLTELSSAEVRQYLSHDLYITYRLGEVWLKVLETIGSLTGMNAMVLNQVAETASPGHIAEVLIHKWLEERHGIVFLDNKRNFDMPGLEKVRASGYGLFTNVAEGDFSMLYPSIYTAYTLDPTSVRNCADGFDVTYIVSGTAIKRKVCFDGGPVYEVLKSFYNLRATTKKVKGVVDQAAKILANSAYGVFSKSGVGMQSAVVGSFIFEFSDKIHADIFNKFNAIYGDTDSIFVVTNEPNKLIEEVNNYVKEKYHNLLELKLEKYWRYIYIPKSKQGGPAKKSMLKISDDGFVKKGVLFRMKDMPTFIRLNINDILTKVVIEGQPLTKVIAEEEIPIEDAFIEDSLSAADFFLTTKGEFKRGSLDKKRARAIAYLAGLMLRVGESLYVKYVEDKILLEVGDRKVRVDPAFIFTVRFLPINEQGEKKEYIIPINNQPYFVRVKLYFNKPSMTYTATLERKAPATKDAVKTVILNWVRKRAYLFE